MALCVQGSTETMALVPVQQFLQIELHALRAVVRFDGTTSSSTLGFLGGGPCFHTNHCPHGHFSWKHFSTPVIIIPLPSGGA